MIANMPKACRYDAFIVEDLPPVAWRYGPVCVDVRKLVSTL